MNRYLNTTKSVFKCAFTQTENNKHCKFYHHLPNHYEKEQSIDAEVEKVTVMSVAKRATPAPIISFRVSIHVSRILSPSFAWHASLNQRLFCNVQFSVPDSLSSHTNTFTHTGRTPAPRTARVINKSSIQHL